MKKLKNKSGLVVLETLVIVMLLGGGAYMHEVHQWGKDNPNHTSSVADPLVRSAQNSTPAWVK